MNYNILKFSLKIFIFSLVVTVASCKKNASDKKDNSTEAAENNAFAEATFNDVTTLVDQAGIYSNITFGAGRGELRDGQIETMGTTGSACATLTIDTVSTPHSITIDFGTTNCVCLDERTRRGKIIATFTGRYRETGTVINITLENYYVNDNKISATKRITNQGNNQAGNQVYKVEVTGEIIKANNGGTITWNSTRYREWKAGANTPLNILDDVYAITGDASGTNANGSSYTISITQELIRKMNCRWFESGKLELTQTGLPKINLDYGTTGCDANATVSILGVNYPVELK